MMRGTPNEYVTYNINPAESRERFAEALHLIHCAWTETRPFGWLGRYYQYRTISIWPRPGLVDQDKASPKACCNRAIRARMPWRSGSARSGASSPTASPSAR